MVNGYVNLPQEIVDAIPAMQAREDGVYETVLEDEALCEEIHRIAALGKPIVISAKLPFGTDIVSQLTLFRTLSSNEYTELIVLNIPDAFTLEIEAFKIKVSGPLEEPAYDKRVEITISLVK